MDKIYPPFRRSFRLEEPFEKNGHNETWLTIEYMIRKASPSDYKVVAKLMIQAMEGIASKFVNNEDPYQATELFEYFFQKEKNQYSYQNTLVYVENDEVAGSLTAYDGTQLMEWRKPILAYISAHYGHQLSLDEESEPGEFYVDTISVNTNHQRKGIGKKLLLAGIDWARDLGHARVGLLVDKHNLLAKQLYSKMGFYTLGSKHLAGSEYEHMVFNIL